MDHIVVVYVAVLWCPRFGASSFSRYHFLGVSEASYVYYVIYLEAAGFRCRPVYILEAELSWLFSIILIYFGDISFVAFVNCSIHKPL